MICSICQKEVDSFRSLSRHLPTHNIKSKEYYDKYIKKGHDGFCLNCGEPTTFRTMGTGGYRKFCSKICADSYHTKNHNEKIVSQRISDNFIKCELCEKLFKNLQGVANHIKQAHDISVQEYYDKFIMKDPKEKICEVCGGKNKFWTITRGYMKACSRQCAARKPGRILLIKDKLVSNRFDKITKKYPILLDPDKLKEEYKKSESVIDLHNKLSIPVTTLVRHLKRIGVEITTSNNISSGEEEVVRFLRDECGVVNIIRNTSTIIHPLHIDIYLPDYKLGIEFDGIYWHTESKIANKNYHLNKTASCENIDIQLLHIFENEWINKRPIWQSIIKNKIGKNSSRIYGRQCEVKVSDREMAKQFLEENHLQGKINASVHLGLYHQGVLVSLLSLGKSRYNKSYEYEILRFCNLLGTSVVGGFGKLYAHFLNRFNPKSIITYADKRYSDGKLYSKFFTLSHTSPPNYWYVVNRELESRVKYQKHKLKDLLQVFDENMTEYENMLSNGFDRVWDSGNIVFTKTF